MERAHEVLKNHTLKSHQSNKSYGGILEKEQGEHQELQNLDPQRFPHLEERSIGGNIDRDLLSLFPQKDARIIGGIERKQAPRGQQWWGKTCSKPVLPKVEDDPFYSET